MRLIWKQFLIGDLFDRSTSLSLNKNQKDLTLSDQKNEYYDVALISASRDGSGCCGYLSKCDYDESKVSINKITFDDQWGYTYFQRERFIITGGHNAILEVRNSKLKFLLDNHLNSYLFISKSINKVTIDSHIYGYGYKINNKLDREIILLPLIESTKEDAIWCFSSKFYTLAVHYIDSLVAKAKQVVESKTINSYYLKQDEFKEKLRFYESKYNICIKNTIWKEFTLGDLFMPITGRDSSIAQKNLDKSDFKNEEYNISIITESTQNNGIGFYMKKNDPILINKIVKDGLTYGTQFGNVNYHYYEHFIIGNVNYLKFKNEKLYNSCTFEVGCFFAKIMNLIFKKSGLFGFVNKIDKDTFSREKILLPLIPASKDESVFVLNDKHYSLSIDVIAYMYYLGQIEFYEKKINNYKCIY